MTESETKIDPEVPLGDRPSDITKQLGTTTSNEQIGRYETVIEGTADGPVPDVQVSAAIDKNQPDAPPAEVAKSDPTKDDNSGGDIPLIVDPAAASVTQASEFTSEDPAHAAFSEDRSIVDDCIAGDIPLIVDQAAASVTQASEFTSEDPADEAFPEDRAIVDDCIGGNIPNTGAALAARDATIAQASEATEINQPDATNAQFSHLRILLLEDDDTDGGLLIERFKRMGIKKIVWVRSVARAHFQLTEDPEAFPDVVVLELALAGTNGIQLLARMRRHENPAIRALPAIVVTSVDSANIFRRVTNQGISGYIKKPVSLTAFAQALNRVREGRTLEKPLEFGRSWIDELEDEEDRSTADEPPSMMVRIALFFFPWLRKKLLPRRDSRVIRPKMLPERAQRQN